MTENPSPRSDRQQAARRAVFVAWGVFGVDAAAVYLSRPALAGDPQFLSLAAVSAAALVILPALKASRERPQSVLLASALLVFFMQSGLIAIGGEALVPLLGLYVVPVLQFSAVSSRATALLAVAAATAAAAYFARLLPLGSGGSPAWVAGLSSIAVIWAAHYYTAGLAGRLRRTENRDVHAERDALTSFYNLTAFRKLAEEQHEKAAAEESHYAVLMVDVDDLKNVNDRYGHATGDRAIALVANILARVKRPNDIVARYAGDKFVVLMPRTSTTDALAVAQKIRNIVFNSTVRTPVTLVRVKANIGVASFPIDGGSFDALISAAESDMAIDRKGREAPAKMPVFERLKGTRGQ